ncbi:outer membrane porin, OprD family [Duganella sp. LX20W]|uniref:Outer membrane porin, OprD family n=1 Tax=Rugamonas brunnea TaxID=2758569 RepID=A0A7W2IA18_9BURK|nr:OprD family outer membrane porin [Rugamonas brunnea]MBA5635774.1 outer membrane porin, OprD family [Rugamonas brunnea]
MRILKHVLMATFPLLACLAPPACPQTPASPEPLSCTAERTKAACLLAAAGPAQAAQAATHDVGASVGRLQPAPAETAQPASGAAAPLLRDGQLTLLFRNFLGTEWIQDTLDRRAWVQTLQANYVSGYTAGPLGLGFSVSPFVALPLDQRGDAGNFVYGHRLGGDGPTVFLGAYTLNARVGKAVFRYGLQRLSNPLLVSRDILSLPPTFQGLTAALPLSDRLMLAAGRLSAVKARGHTSLQALSSGYGGTGIGHVDFAGADWAWSGDGKASVYLDRASDVWRQLYLALTRGAGDHKVLRVTGKADLYATRNDGSSRQGDIGNQAYSLAVTAERGPHAVTAGYQRIMGDQFFDYLGETWGDALLNAMDVDYNAPHEKSAQLRYAFDGASAGLPGFSMMLWRVQGWGADARAGAAAQASPASPLYALYWKNGEPVHGSHGEYGIYPSYVVQSGRWKHAKVTLLAVLHHSGSHYADSSNREFKLRVEFPVKVF